MIFHILRLKKLSVILIFGIIIAVSLNIFNVCCRIEKLYLLDGKTEKCEFVIKDITYKADSYYIADIEIINSKFLKNSTVSATLHTPDISMGDVLSAELKFSILQDSYKSQSYSKEIYLSAYAKNEKLLDKEDFILKGINRIRNYISKTLFKYMDYSEAATLTALIFGDKSYFTEDFYLAIGRAGVNHVMVVSGMHLSVIVAIFAFINNKFVYNRYVKAVIIFGVVFAVSALCGFTMSIMRAGITYLIMALGLVLGRENTPANTLGAATVIILFISPFAIFSIALQLSLLSTFGILCVALPIVNFLLSRKLIHSTISVSIITNILISLSALILTLPVCIYVFGFVSKVGVITNLLIGSAVTVALCLAVLALIINLVFPPAAKLLLFLCEGVTFYINRVITILGNTEKSILSVDKYLAFIAAGIIIVILYSLIACKKRIDMLKLKNKREKILDEGGKRLKWR